MKFRAICTDIDGTLFNSDRQLSTKTIQTIKRLPKNVPVILASSRMPSAMRHLQVDLDILRFPLICYNGGYVTINKDGSPSSLVLESVYIPAPICSGIVALSHRTNIHVSLYEGDNWYAPAIDRWTEREEMITKVKAFISPSQYVLEKWHAENKGAHKIMCMGPEHEIEAMQQILDEKFSEAIHIYRSRPTYLELAPKSISKASGLKLVVEQMFNLTLNDVIAFGDNYNDIEMLVAAGLGVAVGNARDEVKAVANEVTLKSIDDGVAVTLEQYFS